MDTKLRNQLDLLALLANRYDAGSTHVTSLEAANALNLEHEDVVGITKSLEMMSKVRTTLATDSKWKLTDEGVDSLKMGSPEGRLMNYLLKQDQVLASELRMSADKWKSIGLNELLKNKLVMMSSDGSGVVVPTNSKQKFVDKVQDILGTVQSDGDILEEAFAQTLAKRKLVHKHNRTYFNIMKAEKFSKEIPKYETDLTRELLQSRGWKNAEFKPYNFNAAGIVPKCGSIHPLIGTLNMIRSVLVQMGFEEMPTQRWVESSFWNFDALFQPQTHPVRDAHDTFYMKSPANHEPPGEDDVSLLDLSYFQRVRKMHESGDEESLGWQCDWQEAEACKLVMRTHTTAISSQMLRRMGKEYQATGVFNPRRFFSIDRVFRNESLDATHLAEFHQVEGVIAERGASLAQLMGFITTFFEKIGITELKFKPAYNPYTEPSMEIFGYHPLLKKWTEIGNSGVFRPEMLKPMGLPPDVNALGLGLSLERPTMISQGIRDIRELFGPKAKLNVF